MQHFARVSVPIAVSLLLAACQDQETPVQPEAEDGFSAVEEDGSASDVGAADLLSGKNAFPSYREPDQDQVPDGWEPPEEPLNVEPSDVRTGIAARDRAREALEADGEITTSADCDPDQAIIPCDDHDDGGSGGPSESPPGDSIDALPGEPEYAVVVGYSWVIEGGFSDPYFDMGSASESLKWVDDAWVPMNIDAIAVEGASYLDGFLEMYLSDFAEDFWIAAVGWVYDTAFPSNPRACIYDQVGGHAFSHEGLDFEGPSGAQHQDLNACI